MEQSNTAYSLLSPVFGRLRRSKWLPVKVDRTVHSLEVKLYCKDGLHFPPRAELQTLEQAMLSQHMERLKPMLTVLTAGSDIAGSSIASSKGRTEQVYRLPQGRSYILQSIWKNGSFDSRRAKFVMGARQFLASAFAPPQQPLRLFKYFKI
jgi:hypothetical protein